MFEVNIEDIDEYFLKEYQGEHLKITINHLDFYFKINLKNRNDKLIVFSNGAVDPSKSKLPVFMRSKWAEDFNANCLYIDDKTIHNNNLKIGWGVGTENRHYLLDYIQCVEKVRSILNIDSKNTIYYGSSAGGFMSIAMATIDIGTKAIANNPQTYVYRYHKGSVDELFNTIFPKLERNEVIKKMSYRLSLVNIMARSKNVPEIWYLQNRLCKGDIVNHYNPFCENIDKYNIDCKKINFIFYHNKEDGHNPLNRKKTTEFINSVVNDEISHLS